MPKVLIADADAAQLRTFAKIFLGLDVAGNETVNIMKSKLQTAGYAQDFIVAAEEMAQAPAGADRPTSYRTVRLESGKMQKQVCVQVESSSQKGGDRPVPLAVNGVSYLVPRGMPVWIPEEYEEVLRNAVEDHYDQTETGLGVPHASRSYPYSITTPSSATA